MIFDAFSFRILFHFLPNGHASKMAVFNLYEFVKASFFYNTPIVHNRNFISVFNRTQAMSNDDSGASLHRREESRKGENINFYHTRKGQIKAKVKTDCSLLSESERAGLYL